MPQSKIRREGERGVKNYAIIIGVIFTPLRGKSYTQIGANVCPQKGPVLDCKFGRGIKITALIG